MLLKEGLLEASEALLEVDLDRLELIIVEVSERRINLLRPLVRLWGLLLSNANLAPKKKVDDEPQ